MSVIMHAYAAQIEFFPLLGILKKIAYSAPNRICPSQVPFMFASTKREQKQANNQPLCQFATLKAFPFP